MITKLLLASVFCIVPLIAIAAAAGSELFLSDNDIDLLCGVPKGVREPLDSRRTKYETPKTNEFSNLLDEDFYINDSTTMPDWQDAEEKYPEKEEIESEYLDLVSEVESLDNSNAQDDYKDIEYASQTNIASISNEILKEEIETKQEVW